MKRREFLQTAVGLTAGSLAAGCARIPFAGSPRPSNLFNAPAGNGPLRLDRNENPLGPSDTVRQVLSDAIAEAGRYPIAEADELLAALAERCGVSASGIVLGAGSHEILRLAAAGFCSPVKSLVQWEPTYGAVSEYAAAIRAPVVRIPLSDGFEPDLDTLAERCTGPVGLVYLCNPNNPTGRLISARRLRSFIESLPDGVVALVDEAYHEYVDDPAYASMLDMVRDGFPVIVTRTFSKVYALAGLRVGYGICRPDLADVLRRHRTRLGVSLPGLRGALAALDDADFVQKSRRDNEAAKRIVLAALERCGLTYVPPAGNFVFFRPGIGYAAFAEALLRRGIRVGRVFPPAWDWCRVTLGTPDQMRRFSTQMAEALAAG